MLKQAIAAFFLVPAIAWAECGFVSGDSEMTIVVSKKSDNKCFRSSQFREAFRTHLVASVKDMEESAPVPVRYAPRRAPGQKPPVLAVPVQQAVLYYGQNTKR